VSETARIVLLNGVGSAGKGSIAKALQSIARLPLLHVEMDMFLAMVPERYSGDPAGMVFETIEEGDKPTISIHTGPVVERALSGMRRAVAAMAQAGNDLIVDEVMEADAAADYRAVLAPFRLHMVGVFCPLDVLEAREKARGDREIGLARWQFDRVHKGIEYDLEIDSGATTPLENAQRIRDAFDL
jgi:chloramphenicol 3-O phosphotransferase